MVSRETLERCRRGDPVAFEELVEQTYRQAFTLALRLVGDRQEAEDVVQEAYLRVFRSLGGFRGEAAFETWLHRIVVNAAMNQLARRGRFGQLMAEPDDLEPVTPAVHEDRLADRDELERALDRLSPGHRTVLLLKDAHGLSCEEIARSMGTTEGAVKVRLHRARKRLKEIVYGEEPARHEV